MFRETMQSETLSIPMKRFGEPHTGRMIAEQNPVMLKNIGDIGNALARLLKQKVKVEVYSQVDNQCQYFKDLLSRIGKNAILKILLSTECHIRISESLLL